MGEYDFPTVRKGSYILMGFFAVLMVRVLITGADTNLVNLGAALLTAVSGTHAMLVLGGAFNNSRWSTTPPVTSGTTEKTTKETIVVTPAIEIIDQG